MKLTTADTGARMTLSVTDAERSTAKQVKTNFDDIIKKLDKSVRSVTEFRDALIAQHPSQQDLVGKYKGRFLRYRRKIQTAFNDFLTSVKTSLELLDQISDPDMLRLREILGAEIAELSEGCKAVLDLLKETDKKDFTKTLERIAAQLEKRQRSIEDVITSQLYSHLNHDILGRMRISEMRFKIKRRARILKQFIRSL